MKNSNEITEYVLRMRNAYQKKLCVRNRRIKTAAAVCSMSLVLCVSVISFSYLSKKDSLPANESDFTEKTTYTTQIKKYPSENHYITDLQPTSENTVQTSENRVTDHYEKSENTDVPEKPCTSVQTETEKTVCTDTDNITSSVKKTEHTRAKMTAENTFTVPVCTSAIVTGTETSTQEVTKLAYITSYCGVTASCSESTSADTNDILKYVSFTMKNRRYNFQNEITDSDLAEEKLCTIMFRDFTLADIYKIKDTDIYDSVLLNFIGSKKYYLYKAE